MGDTPDLESLLRERSWLRRIARSLASDPADADDLAQDTLLAATSRAPRDPARLRPWLVNAARKLALRRRRDRARLARRERLAARPEATQSAADEAAERELRRRLAEALCDLDEPYRRTVLLRAFGGLSAAKIARREGVPPATVRSRHARALERLRAVLDERSGGREAWLALALRVAPEAKGAVASAGAVGGAIAMATWTKLTLGAAASAAIALVVWRGGLGESELDVTSHGRPPGGEAVALANEPAAERAAADPEVDVPATSGRRRALAETGTAGPAGLELRVVDADERPQEHALVALHRGDELLWSGRTDPDGRALAPPPGADARALVLAAGHAARVADVPAKGEHVLRLPRGEILAGRVLVDGVPPERPIELALVSRSRDELAGVPRTVRERLWPDGRAVARTGEGGAFSFEGLDPDWWGRLVAPTELAWVEPFAPEEGNTVELTEPSRGGTYRLRSLPLLRGRVVTRGGEPIAGASGMAMIGVKRGRTSPGFGVRTDEHGRFVVPLRVSNFSIPSASGRDHVELREVHLGLAATGFHGRDFAFGAAELGGELDLGDLVLEPRALRSVGFAAVDSDGQPIEGALAGSVGGNGAIDGISAPTDARGLGEIEVDERVQRIAVAAIGHRLVSRALEDSEPVRVALPPSNVLALRVLSSDGTPAAAVVVELETAGPPYLDGRGAGRVPNRLHVAAGATMQESGSFSQATGRGRARFRTGAAGEILLTGLSPHGPVHLRVLDAVGRVLVDEVLPPLGRERHERTYSVPSLARALRGSVLDEHGVPLTGAQVTASDGGGASHAYTDGDGGFEIRPIAASTVSVSVRRRGFVRERFVDHDTAEPLLVRLRPARDVRVRLLDDAGSPVPGWVSAVVREGSRVRGERLSRALFELRDLPPEPVRLVARVAGRDYEREHDALVPEATIQVPVHGVVFVRVSDDLGLDGVRLLDVRLFSGKDDEEPLEEGTWPDVLREDGFHVLAPPGRYEAVLGSWLDDLDEWRPLAPPLPVTVEPGATAEIVFTP